jgi:hypothetical protein
MPIETLEQKRDPERPNSLNWHLLDRGGMLQLSTSTVGDLSVEVKDIDYTKLCWSILGPPRTRLRRNPRLVFSVLRTEYTISKCCWSFKTSTVGDLSVEVKDIDYTKLCWSIFNCSKAHQSMILKTHSTCGQLKHSPTVQEMPIETLEQKRDPERPNSKSEAIFSWSSAPDLARHCTVSKWICCGTAVGESPWRRSPRT